MTKDFLDFSGLDAFTRAIDPVKIGRGVIKAQRWAAAQRVYKEVLERYGHETAEAAAAAVKAGRSPDAILERAERLKNEREEREALLASPPPLHGSARWASTVDLGKGLRSREAFDDPRSILLGTVMHPDGKGAAGFLHWDDDGHLMTLAPTRSGKAITTIVPNLLRYQGSCVVLDPKGELYASTSKWRSTLGPVYRIAPFDTGADPATAQFPRHGYNPLAHIRSQAEARALAELMFPKDPKGQEFFSDDAVSFLTGLILLVLDDAPPHLRNIGTLRQMTAASVERLRESILPRMRQSVRATVREAAENVLGKSLATGLPNLRDTLNSKLALWSDEALIKATDRDEVDFASLKDQTATVYVTVPFELLKPYAPFVKVLLKGALDAMLRNPRQPDIPVLFILDEFLALGSFPEFRDAIRTHASAGVRLWFFLQDLGSLQEFYPGTGWWSFFNCSVKQFFGTDDHFTAELIGKDIGQQTVAYRATNAGANVSASMGGEGSAGVNFSSGESVNFLGRALLNLDEVVAELAPWLPDGTRNGIIKLRNPPYPVRVRLVPHSFSERCRERLGAFQPSPGEMSDEHRQTGP
jgi:type IV secretion system protein VirD4